MRQPAILLLPAVWVGLLLGAELGNSLVCLVVPLLAIGVIVPIFRDRRVRMAAIVAACFLAGVVRSPEASWNRTVPPRSLAGATRIPVVLEVATPFLAAECSDRVVARVERVVAGPVVLGGCRVMLRGFEEITPPGRSRFIVCGKFEAPKPRLNPYAMDMRTQYARLGVVGAVDITAIVGKPGRGPVAKFSGFREQLEALILKSYPGEASGMLAAMLLGQRRTVSPHVQTVMLKAGTYHVIAVSGLHVVIVIMVLSSFLSILGLPRALLAAIYCIAVVFYVIFTGNPPSAVRAAGLFLAATACRLLEWKVDFTNVACAAGTVLLVALPYFAWDIGFQLSLGAVIGMTVLGRRLEAPRARDVSIMGKVARYLYSGFAVCLAAQAFTLPIVLYDFGRASLVAPIGNLIMVPLTTLAIAAGIEGSFGLVLSQKLANVLFKSAAFLTHVSIYGTDLVTRLPHALIFSGRPGSVRIIIYCLGLAALAFGLPRARRWVMLTVLVCLHGFLILPLPWHSDRLARLTFLHVGDGDAILVETPGFVTLVDAGPNTELQGQAQNQVVRYLGMRGIGRLDRVVVTHSHDDHYGGLVSLIESVGVGELVVGTLHGEPDYEHLIDRARRKGIGVRVAAGGDAWASGGGHFEVLAAGGAPSDSADPNSQSVVIRFTFGGFGAVFTGDVTPEIQRDIAGGARDLSCDVLKVPHHGARAWIDPDFLARLHAKFAVITVGSRFASHPSPETVAFLASRGLRVLITSRDGAVTILTDGRRMQLVTERAWAAADSY
ncbi:MAG TPA: DNA internalization-related competence protein ComEC/Rec2 [bacterium]|nr:DNA internalization-related competence protein ComEC/Rec2 [bacterium]